MAFLKTRDGGTSSDLLDQMFESFFDWQPATRYGNAFAPLDLYEKDGKYVLEVATPGYDTGEINVEVDGGTVTISGQHVEKSEKKDVKYHRREIRRGSFSRSVTLPQDLDAENISATMEKGVLKVVLAPARPIAPKKIEVKPA